MKTIENQTFDMERALYASDGVFLKIVPLTGRQTEKAL